MLIASTSSHRQPSRAAWSGFAAFAIALVCASPVGADVFTDTFTSGINVGEWAYGGNETIESSGGNPGAFLHSSELDTFAPMPSTFPNLVSPFSGNYRARNVSRLGVDLILFHVDFSAEERPLTLILIHDNDTPADFSDDYGVYTMGENIPLEGEGWKHYEFDVPAQSSSLPSGWRRIQFGENSPKVNWNTVIQNVDRVMYFYGDPEFFFIFQMWEVGLDNAFIEDDPSTGDATLTSLQVVRGTLLAGGLPELVESDDQSIRVRSGFGTTFSDLHSMDLTVGAETDVVSPTSLDVTIEARVSHGGGGTVRVRLFNHDTGQFDQIGLFAASTTDVSRTFENVDANNYIEEHGTMRVGVRSIVVVPIFAFNYDTFVDHVRVVVE